MRKTLLLSAALALLAGPALAQDHSDHRQGHAPNGQTIGGPAGHGGMPQNRGPAAQPNPGNNPGPAMRRDDNRGPGPSMSRDNNRHGNDRNDNWHGNNRNDRHGGPGPAMRPGDHRPGMGPRPDYRSYNRNFRAPRRFHAPSYHRPSGWYYRRWTFGQTLPSLFWAPQYWLNDYFSYDLPAPPPGTVWVRYGNDALLVDRFTGEIITVEYDVFY
jgi:Ni/Co efflux regulator RcnB